MSEIETQERIVEQASELFRRYGVRSVTMDDIASHLSISKKTIYQFFKDKKEIVRVCLQHIVDCEFTDMDAIEAKSKDVMEELVYISEYFRKMIARMNPSLLFDLKKYHADAWEVYLDAKQTRYLDKIKRNLKRGQEQGFIRKEINVDIASRMRMEMVEIGFNPDVFPPDKYDISALQMELFDYFFHSVTTYEGKELMEKYVKEHAAQAQI